MKTVKISWEEFEKDMRILTKKIAISGIKYKGIHGIPRGGIIPAIRLSHIFNLPLILAFWASHTDILWIDDVIETGKSLEKYSGDFACLYWNPNASVTPLFWAKKKKPEVWIEFPWEYRYSERIWAHFTSP